MLGVQGFGFGKGQGLGPWFMIYFRLGARGGSWECSVKELRVWDCFWASGLGTTVDGINPALP